MWIADQVYLQNWSGVDKVKQNLSKTIFIIIYPSISTVMAEVEETYGDISTVVLGACSPFSADNACILSSIYICT